MIPDKWPLFQILPGQVLVIIELALGLEDILATVCFILDVGDLFKKIILYKKWTQRGHRRTPRHTNSGVAGTNLHMSFLEDLSFLCPASLSEVYS